MGARSYCWKCEGGMPEATVREVVDGVQECRLCFASNAANRDLADVIGDLIDRIETLESRSHWHAPLKEKL